MSNGNFDDYYKQLEGYTIKQYSGTTEDAYGDGFPQFVLTKQGHPTLYIEVSRDPEGNGGGFLFITDDDGGEEELCRCHGHPVDECPFDKEH